MIDSLLLDRTGVIGLTIGGGRAPYTYVWSDLSGNGQPQNRSNVAAGTYRVTVESTAATHRIHLQRLEHGLTSEKHIPRGLLFELVSCPHYSCEVVSWLAFNCVTGTLAGVVFMLAGSAILAAWAHTRHVAYRQQFDGQDGRPLYPAQRRALVPWLF